MGKPSLTLLVLALAFAVLPKTLSASCARVGAPRASEVEILECINARDYFDSHYEQLHPATRDTSERSTATSISE